MRLRPRLRHYVPPELTPAPPAPIGHNEPPPDVEVASAGASARRVSGINPAFPVFGVPTTASVRTNFQAAKDEIEALQAEKLDLAGGTMSGNIVFAPTQRLDGGTFGPPPFRRR